MPGTPRTDGPRHLAGEAHSSDVPPHRQAAHLAGAAHAAGALDAAVPAEIVRVPRSRLALALAVTIAALPILVLDNLPATADTGQAADEVASTVIERALRAAETSTTEPTTTTAAPTTITTAAPATTTTAAPTTTAAAPPTTAPAPPTTAAPHATSYAYGDPNDPASWDRLAQCESGGDWHADTGNGYFGGLQFSKATWDHYGGTGYPHEHLRETQIEIGKRLQASEGWDAWPGCSRELGYS
ncbi:MAG: transglycosylase family protein [Actinomycetota bacterium]